MTIKQLGGVFGRNPTFNDVTIEGTLTFDGALDINSDINLPDNKKITFGDNSDLSIYSDNSHSYIQEGAGTSGIRITTDNSVAIRKHDDENIAVFNVDGAVRLYHDNAERIATTSTGIDITGDITLGDNNPTITFNDSSITDLSHTISSASDNLRISADVNGVDAGSRVEIFDGTTEVARFEAGAVDVTGTVTADGLTVDGASTINVNDATTYLSTSRANGFLQINNINTTSGVFSGIELIATGTGSAGAAEIICIDRGDGSGDLAFSTRSGGTWGERVRIDSSGRVGIGTSSPSTLLHLSSTDPRITLTDTTLAGNCNHVIRGSDQFLLISADDGNTQGTSSLRFNVDASEAMRIDASGHVIAPYGVTLGTAAGTYNAANTLDDYEEGTFTPTVYSSDNTTVLTSGVDYDLNDYRYVKTGNHVMMEVRIRDLRTTKTDIWCTLPFTSSTSDSGVGITAEGDVIYLASDRLNFRKGTNQYPYGIVNFESS